MWCWVLHLVLRVVSRPDNKKRQDEDGSSCRMLCYLVELEGSQYFTKASLCKAVMKQRCSYKIY